MDNNAIMIALLCDRQRELEETRAELRRTTDVLNKREEDIVKLVEKIDTLENPPSKKEPS